MENSPDQVCRLCSAPHVIFRTVELSMHELEIDITTPLCGNCFESAPQKIREVLESRTFKACASIIGGGFASLLTPERVTVRPRY